MSSSGKSVKADKVWPPGFRRSRTGQKLIATSLLSNAKFQITAVTELLSQKKKNDENTHSAHFNKPESQELRCQVNASKIQKQE